MYTRKCKLCINSFPLNLRIRLKHSYLNCSVQGTKFSPISETGIGLQITEWGMINIYISWKKKLSIESFHTANTKCRLLDEMHFSTLCALSIVLLTLHACHSIESLTFLFIERLSPPCSPCISLFYLIWKIPLGFRGENTTCSWNLK